MKEKFSFEKERKRGYNLNLLHEKHNIIIYQTLNNSKTDTILADIDKKNYICI